MDRILDLWDGKAIQYSEVSELFLFCFFSLEDGNAGRVPMIEAWFVTFQREANTFCQGPLCDILN